MKVYTKTGDAGQTSLIGGGRAPKNHPRIEAYGTVDELMAHAALLTDMLGGAGSMFNCVEGSAVQVSGSKFQVSGFDGDCEFLSWIMERLMTVSSTLAAEGDVTKRLPAIKAGDIERIEHRIDEMERDLEPLKHLVLPGGHPALSQCHVTRTVCRRAERTIVGLTGGGYAVPAEVTAFVNRLSDYFFVLSRKIAKDLNISTKKWHPVVSD